VAIRTKFPLTITQLVSRAAKTSEPFVTSMEYDFPGLGYEKLQSQFMLGSSIMVVPMQDKGNKRMVVFPKGEWKADEGSIIADRLRKRLKWHWRGCRILSWCGSKAAATSWVDFIFCIPASVFHRIIVASQSLRRHAIGDLSIKRRMGNILLN
jgi:Glycosyl hydrolases family 31